MLAHWLIFPLRVLREGHVWVLLFLGVMLSSAVLGAVELSAFFVREIGGVKMENATLRAALLLLARFGPWLLVAPLVLASVALPVRILWISSERFLSRTCGELSEAVSLSYRSCSLALNASLAHIAPGVTLLAIHEIGVARLNDTGAMRIVLVAAVLALSIALFRHAATIFSPFISILTFWEPAYAVDMAPQLLHGRLRALLGVALGGLVAAGAFYYSMHGLAPVTLKRLPWWELTVYTFTAWHVLTLLACLIIFHIQQEERLWKEREAALAGSVPFTGPYPHPSAGNPVGEDSEEERIPFPF